MLDAYFGDRMETGIYHVNKFRRMQLVELARFIARLRKTSRDQGDLFRRPCAQSGPPA